MAAPRQWSESAGRGLLKTPVSSCPALQLDEFVKVVPGLAQVLYAALVAPAAAGIGLNGSGDRFGA